MKVSPKNFKGINYIQVNQLPKDQHEKFIQTTPKSLHIKILIEGKVVSGCVQYKDYSLWYDNVYLGHKPEVQGTKIKNSVTLKKV